MANNHPLLSLYENPLAAGVVADDDHGKAASAHRLVSYLTRGAADESAAALAPVASLPHVPPRADAAFAPVASLPHVPPRNHLEFAAVASIPSLPPRA